MPVIVDGAGPSAGVKLTVSRIRPAYEQVAAQLRDLIVRGELGPGDRLPTESDLATSFGVSRGTVREALRVLASRHLVYSSRGAAGGTFVAETDQGTISEYLTAGLGLLRVTRGITQDELLEACHLFEVPAARLAARRRTDAHLAALAAVVAEATALGAPPPADHQLRFHALVLAASGNRLLALMTEPVFGVVENHLVDEKLTGVFWREVRRGEEEILARIVARDELGAGGAMYAHLLRLAGIYRGNDRVRRPQP